LVNAELFRQTPTRSAWCGSNGLYLLDRQFRIAVAAFHRRVVRIVGMGAKEEMIHSAAKGRVAAVQHEQSVRDWSVRLFPRGAVSQSGLIRGADQSIPFIIASSGPRPARRWIIWTMNLFKQSRRDGSRLGRAAAAFRTPSGQLSATLANAKECAARRTVQVNVRRLCVDFALSRAESASIRVVQTACELFAAVVAVASNLLFSHVTSSGSLVRAVPALDTPLRPVQYSARCA
jgi:hypothetical protein